MKKTLTILSLAVLANAVLVVAGIMPAYPGPASMPTDDAGVVGWIWDAFARGDLALAVAGVILTLVRLVRGAKLESRIPEKYLPWLSMGLATLTQVSTALFAGASWGRAILIGISTGLMASGLWSAGAKAAPIVGKKKEVK